MADGNTALNTAASAAVETSASPEVLGGVVSYLSLSDAGAAADFYTRAFGAVEVARMGAPGAAPGDTRVCHLHLHVNGGSLMLSDAFPEHGCPLQAPQAFNLMLLVDDARAWWSRAVEAGAEIVMPLDVQFWGDLYGQLRDPFGVTWALNQPAPEPGR